MNSNINMDNPHEGREYDYVKIVALIPCKEKLMKVAHQDLVLLCQKIGVNALGPTFVLQIRLLQKREKTLRLLESEAFKEDASGEMIEELVWKAKEKLATIEDNENSQLLKVTFPDHVHLRKASLDLILSSLRGIDGVKGVTNEERKDEVVVLYCNLNYLIIKLAGASLFDENLTSISSTKKHHDSLLSYQDGTHPDYDIDQLGFSYQALIMVQFANRAKKDRAAPHDSDWKEHEEVFAPGNTILQLGFGPTSEKNLRAVEMIENVAANAGKEPVLPSVCYQLFLTVLDLSKDEVHEDLLLERQKEGTAKLNKWRKFAVMKAMLCLRDAARKGNKDYFERCAKERELEHLLQLERREKDSIVKKFLSLQMQHRQAGSAAEKDCMENMDAMRRLERLQVSDDESALTRERAGKRNRSESLSPPSNSTNAASTPHDEFAANSDSESS